MAVVLRQFPRSYLGELNHAVWRSAAYIGLFAQQLGQFRYIHRNPSRLIGGEDLINPLRFGRQKPNNYRYREHEGPRNQMISRKVRAKLGYMLYQKRQATKR